MREYHPGWCWVGEMGTLLFGQNTSLKNPIHTRWVCYVVGYYVNISHLVEILPRHSSTYISGTGWFKLKDGHLFPGQSPRRFFEWDRENLHTTSRSPYEGLTNVFFLFFCFFIIFRQLRLCWGIWTSFRRPNIIGRKKKERNPPKVQASELTLRTHVQKNLGVFLENDVDIWAFVRKSV